jgi:prepilin-type N-terminal cleavage/methylation domain-containing protein
VKTRRRADDRGFTLLEIIVTLGILGIVLAIVYGVFAQTIAGKERAEARGDDAAAARAALWRITRDLLNTRPAATRPSQAAPRGSAAAPTPPPSALLPQHGLFLARVRTERGVAVDDLAFTAFLRRPTAITFGATDLGIVHYFVAPVSAESPEQGLYRETVFSLTGEPFDPDQPDPANAALILPGVSGFEVRLFDGKEWLPDWDSLDSRNFAPAPYAVEMTLTVVNDRNESETFQTAVDVPMARGLRAPRVVAGPTPRG